MDNEEAQPEPVSPESKGDRLKNRVLKPGESFGNFRVVKCMTAGLMANYYHMQHVRDLHDVTVGIFHHRTMKDVNCLKRLQALQKTLQSFSHESIPKIMDCAVINERHCIFLEPVNGQSLSQYFAAHGTPGQAGIDLDDATHIIARLLGLLGYAHSQGVDHRDLDSDLIFVKEDGALQVLGLGIKAALGVELFESIVSASVSPLESNKTVGRLNSFDVMSPEYKGGISEDHKVDVYAVGAIGYWLLCGCKAKMGQWEAPSGLIEDLPKTWDNFLAKSLERDQDARLQSCKLALLALKETELEPESEGAGFVQRQIDRIPVPKGILDRGELATRVYRLSIIGVVGLILTALAAAYLKETFTETRTYVRSIAKVAVAAQAPDLIINVKPSAVKLQFTSFKDNFIASEGKINLLVQPGEYKILVTAPQHREKVLPVTIPKVKDGPLEIDVTLKPAWTDFQINSEPGAGIFVVDDRNVEIDLGVADEEGIFFLKKGLFAGTYKIIVRKSGYEERALDNQEIAFGGINEIEVPLNPLPSSLTVQTNPSGARIFVNDVEIGISPVTTTDLAPSEHYLVIAHLDNYRSLGRRIEIEAGEDEVVDFGELLPSSGEVAFEVSFANAQPEEIDALMSELFVEIDGTKLPYGSNELKTVSAGPRTIRLVHSLYISKPEKINVKDRDVITLKAILSPRPAVIEMKIPDGFQANVRLNRVDVEVTDGIVEIPAKQSVEFELRIPNHLTMVRLFNLKPNERIVWNVEPVPIPNPKFGQKWTMPYLGHEFAWVAPGQFNMGSPPPEPGRLPNEGPQTRVRFTRGFWVGMYEVTQAQYLRIMDRNPSEFAGSRNPVESVTWEDAKLFCLRLTAVEKAAGRLPEGYVYRLPTESEWEYAARAGTETPYAFGERADATMGNFRGVYPKGSEEGVRVADNYGTLAVGSYEPNSLGLYDVHGNAQEWTLDYYNGRLSGGSLTDPKPRTVGSRIAARGGSWEDYATHVRSAARGEIRPDTKSNAIGFRVVLAPEL